MKKKRASPEFSYGSYFISPKIRIRTEAKDIKMWNESMESRGKFINQWIGMNEVCGKKRQTSNPNFDCHSQIHHCTIQINWWHFHEKCISKQLFLAQTISTQRNSHLNLPPWKVWVKLGQYLANSAGSAWTTKWIVTTFRDKHSD